MNKWILLIFPVLLMVACSGKDESTIDETITIAGEEVEDPSAPVILEVALNTVNIRKSPSMDSSVVTKLAIATKVEWQNELSEVTAPVKLRGVRYNDPWLYVKTSDDKKGWVYAATVTVHSKNQSGKVLKQQLLKRRVDTFFGQELSASISNYNQAYVQATNSERFANVYAYGQGLRDQLVAVLDKKASTSVKPLADMSWLDNILIGYTKNLVTATKAKKKQFYLSADFQQMSKKAQQTEGDEDNQFIAFLSSVFADGRETPAIGKLDKDTLTKLGTLTESLSYFRDSFKTLKSRIATQ